ncbi:hypothetical protein, partial [Peribacillus simplex]|uniref:hypothetical protein n=1 Tax=Peribacillus simplex TaxID=1478 RepID=UPI003CF26B1D
VIFLITECELNVKCNRAFRIISVSVLTFGQPGLNQNLLLIAHHLHFFHPGTDENHWQINAKSLPVESLLVTKNDQVAITFQLR